MVKTFYKQLKMGELKEAIMFSNLLDEAEQLTGIGRQHLRGMGRENVEKLIFDSKYKLSNN